MATVLVVDDSPMDRLLAGKLLKAHSDLHVIFAGDGREALDEIQHSPPDLVVTDLQMPRLDGLQLVETIKRDYPSIPVLLMTARGSEEIAAEALKKGAASYVTKSNLTADLKDVVLRILAAANEDRMHSRLMHSLTSCECQFVLQNDPALLDPLVSHLQEMLRCLPLGDEAERVRVGVALKHAFWNGHCFGNLEIPVEADTLDSGLAAELIKDRRIIPPYCERQLMVRVRLSNQVAEFTVQHQGAPLRIESLTQSQLMTNSTRPFVRGLILMRSIMDEVVFSDDGREITLTKRAVNDALKDLLASAPMAE